MLKRPSKFEDVVGHTHLIEFLKNHVSGGTLPRFLILEGDEGLGKTTIAKLISLALCCESENKPCYTCKTCTDIMSNVIDKNMETKNVKLFNMSINGGKDSAKDVVDNFNLGVSGIKTKVILLDEAHAMSDAAQEVFLVDTEYLPSNVYVILITTNSYNLIPTLKSRAFSIKLNKLKKVDLMILLKDIVRERNLNVQGGDATLGLIADWADGKPRIALNLLSGFQSNSAVSADLIKEFIGYVDVDDVIDLLSYLGGSMTHGLMYINSLHLSDGILDICLEVLKIKKGLASFKLNMDDALKVRTKLANVDEEVLVKFIYEFAALVKVNKRGLIASFIKAHPMYSSLVDFNPSILQEELQQKSDLVLEEPDYSERKAPTMESLLQNGSIVEVF
ncbi:MAG: AAA family ATPase [Endomicrobium sp.]|jgi:DNA polymerase III gamma/tau subunit|nr:AAA family ATPase [Endomicrobium sp.]